jgi:uncharacterized membrane protein YdjX (TVP38/TMEM64 family)
LLEGSRILNAGLALGLEGRASFCEMDQADAVSRRKLWLKLGVAALALLVLAAALAAGIDLKALAQRGSDLITQAGPVPFFAAMAVLPAMGVPMLAFVLPVAPAFAERFGLGLVIVFSLLAITFNFMFAYVLSRWLLRPWVGRLVEKLGYRMPELKGSDSTDLLIILRVTPGVPFVVQNFMAGLTRVPLGRYVIVSCIATWAFNTCFILFGDALLHGRGRLAMVAIGLFAALSAATHMVRKHYAAKARKSEMETSK